MNDSAAARRRRRLRRDPDARPGGGRRASTARRSACSARSTCPERNYSEFETGNLTISVIDAETMGIEPQPQPERARAARRGRRRGARGARSARASRFAADTLDTGVCHMAFFADPDGNALMLHHRYAPADHGGLSVARPWRRAGERSCSPAPARCSRATRASCPSATISAAPSAARSRCDAAGLSSAPAASRSTRTRSRWRPAASSRSRATRTRCPRGETGRRDYRLAMPDDRGPGGLGHDRRRASRGRSASSRAARLAAIPLQRARGRRATLAGFFDAAAALRAPVTLIANLATHHLWGGAPDAPRSCSPTSTTASWTGPPPDWDVGPLRLRRRAHRRAGRTPLRARRHLSLRSATSGVHLQPRGAARGGDRARRQAGRRRDRGGRRARTRRGCATARRGARAARGPVGQRHDRGAGARERRPSWSRSSCCDLGAIVRGRAVFASELAGAPRARRRLGAGQPRADAARPARRTEPVRLDRRSAPAARPARRACGSAPSRREPRSSCCCATSSRLDGAPWDVLPADASSRDALAELREREPARGARELRARVPAARDASAARAARSRSRRSAPPSRSRRRADGRAGRGRTSSPSASSPSSRATSSRSRSAPAAGMAAADRAVVLREVVREVARRGGCARNVRAAARPRRGRQRRPHPHQPARRRRAARCCTTPRGPASLSELGGSFAAGVLAPRRRAERADARRARCRPSACARTTGARARSAWRERNREALLRIPPLAGARRRRARDARCASSTAAPTPPPTPTWRSGRSCAAGLEGIAARLPAPPILDRDPADARRRRRPSASASARCRARSRRRSRRSSEDEAARGWLAPPLYEAYATRQARGASAATASSASSETLPRAMREVY